MANYSYHNLHKIVVVIKTDPVISDIWTPKQFSRFPSVIFTH